MDMPLLKSFAVDGATLSTRLEPFRSLPHVAGEYLDFSIGVFEAQRATYLGCLAATTPVEGDASVPLPSPGESLLTPAQVVVLPELVQELFGALQRLVVREDEADGAIPALAEAASGAPQILIDLVEVVVFGQTEQGLKLLSSRTRVPMAALLMIGRLLASPFVAAAVEGLPPREGSTEARGTCPCCGAPPAFAYLRPEDGGRVLICSMCDEPWSVPRLECPFCGNGDQAKLGVLRLDDERVRHLEVCDVCRRYLKTLDGRNLAPTETIVPLVEDVVTLHLDLVAERHGFLRSQF